MLEKLRGFFMNVLNLFHFYTIEEVTGIETNITAEMRNRIELWCDMMAGHAPWNEKAPSCGVLEQIAGRLSSLVLREIGLECDNDAIKEVMAHLNNNVDKIVEYIVLLGGCVVRPVYSGGRIQYEALPLGCYLPTKYDFDGTLTGAVLLKQIDSGNKKWLLTEEHSFDSTDHTVKCTLYRNDRGALKRTALSDCPQTAELTPEYTWQDCKMPMIVEFRNHAVNKIDGSNVPVALISGAEELIKQADEQFERMNWEQEGGKMRVFADRDLFQKRVRRNGESVNVEMSESLSSLVVQIDGDGTANGQKITEHAPNLRTQQQNEMLQEIFRRIELTCNIGKGTVSDMENVAQTATQYTGGRQELYAVVDRIEEEIEGKYHKCADVFAYMSAAYGLGANDSRIVITWNDDQTRKDITAAKQMALQEVSAGVRNKWEYRADFFGEDEVKAKANTPQAEAADSFGGMFGA